MLTILTLALLIHLSHGHCVFTENYWKSRKLNEWPVRLQTKTLCNNTWFELLHTKSDTLWNRTFREICIANLNNYAKGIEKGEEVLKGMKIMCNFTERWKDSWEIVLPAFMNDMKNYNRGLSIHPLCPLTHLPVPIPTPTTSLLISSQVNDNRVYVLVIIASLIPVIAFLIIWKRRMSRGPVM